MPKPSSVSSSEGSMSPAKTRDEDEPEKRRPSLPKTDRGPSDPNDAKRLLSSTLRGLAENTNWSDYAAKLDSVTSSKNKWTEGQRRWVFEELSKARKTIFGRSNLPIAMPDCEISGIDDTDFGETRNNVVDLVSWLESTKSTIGNVPRPARQLLERWVDKKIKTTFDPKSQESKSQSRAPSSTPEDTVTNPGTKRSGHPGKSSARDETVTNTGRERTRRHNTSSADGSRKTSPTDRSGEQKPKASYMSKLKTFLPELQKTINLKSILPTVEFLSNIDTKDTDQLGYTVEKLQKLHQEVFGTGTRFFKDKISFDASKVSSEYKDKFKEFEDWATENSNTLQQANQASKGHISRLLRGLVHEKLNAKTSKAFESTRKVKRAARYAVGQEMAKKSNETNGIGTEESNMLNATLASELGHIADATEPDTSKDDAMTKEIRNTDFKSVEQFVGGVWDKLEEHMQKQPFKWGTDATGKKCAIKTATTKDGQTVFRQVNKLYEDGTMEATSTRFDPFEGKQEPLFSLNGLSVPGTATQTSLPATTSQQPSKGGILSTLANTASSALGSLIPSSSLIAAH